MCPYLKLHFPIIPFTPLEIEIRAVMAVMLVSSI